MTCLSTSPPPPQEDPSPTSRVPPRGLTAESPGGPKDNELGLRDVGGARVGEAVLVCDLRPQVLLMLLGLGQVEASVVVDSLGVRRPGIKRCVSGVTMK